MQPRRVVAHGQLAAEVGDGEQQRGGEADQDVAQAQGAGGGGEHDLALPGPPGRYPRAPGGRPGPSGYPARDGPATSTSPRTRTRSTQRRPGRRGGGPPADVRGPRPLRRGRRGRRSRPRPRCAPGSRRRAACSTTCPSSAARTTAPGCSRCASSSCPWTRTRRSSGVSETLTRARLSPDEVWVAPEPEPEPVEPAGQGRPAPPPRRRGPSRSRLALPAPLDRQPALEGLQPGGALLLELPADRHEAAQPGRRAVRLGQPGRAAAEGHRGAPAAPRPRPRPAA